MGGTSYGFCASHLCFDFFHLNLLSMRRRTLGLRIARPLYNAKAQKGGIVPPLPSSKARVPKLLGDASLRLVV